MNTIKWTRRILPALLCLAGCADPPEAFDPESVQEVDFRKSQGSKSALALRYTVTKESEIQLVAADPAQTTPGIAFQRFSGTFFAGEGKLIGSDHRLIVDVDSFRPEDADSAEKLVRSPEGLASERFPNLAVFFESAESGEEEGAAAADAAKLAGVVEIRGLRLPFQIPADLSIEGNRLSLTGSLDLPLNGPEFQSATLLQSEFGDHLRLTLSLVAVSDGKPQPVAIGPASRRQGAPVERRLSDRPAGKGSSKSPDAGKGTLVSPELTSEPRNRVTNFISNRDADQDGLLSPEETGPFWEMLSRADADGDSLLSPEELKNARLPVEGAGPKVTPKPKSP